MKNSITVIGLLIAIFGLLSSCHKQKTESQIEVHEETQSPPLEVQTPPKPFGTIQQDAFKTIAKPLASTVDVIYNQSNQDAIEQEIRDLKNDYTYTAENPLLLHNPYGTNPLSVYVYFKHPRPINVWYTIEANETPYFTRQVHENQYFDEIEFLALGFIPNKDCTLNIFIKAQEDETFTCYRFTGKIDTPPIPAAVPLQLTKDFQSTEEQPSQGLFVTHHILTATWQNIADDFFFYDNDGYLRGQLIKGTLPSRLLIDGDVFIYEFSPTAVALVSKKSGKVLQIYESNLGIQHHDMILGTQNDLLRMINKDEQKEDLIERLDRQTGIATTLINFRDYFEDYDFSKNKNDWFHGNSISCWQELNGTTSLIISARELSAILKVKDIYGSKEIDWIITSNDNIKKAYPQYTYLNKNFGRPSLGQHTTTYVPHESDPSKYYIHFFNNFWDHNKSDNQYDYDNLDTSEINKSSFFEKYLIDETIKSTTPVQSIKVAHARTMSSTQWQSVNFGYTNNSNIIISCGSGTDTTNLGDPLQLYEYTEEGKLILQFSFPTNIMFYRFFKYNL
ncbi:MAG: hypothetical protein ACRC4W_01495 [Treponemataceae bacterium]